MTSHGVQSPWSLVGSAQAGDRDAFGRIYQLYAREVNNYVYNRVADPHLAEDFTQETFTRGLRRIDSVTDQGRDIGAWLTTIAGNIVRDHVKSSTHQRERFTEDVKDRAIRDHLKPGESPRESGALHRDTSTPSAEHDALRNLTSAAVRDAVAQLNDPQRTAIEAQYFDDLSTTEAAERAGCNVGAHKARAFRGREELRETLPADLYDGQPAKPSDVDLAGVEADLVALDLADTQRTEQLAAWHTDAHAVDAAGDYDNLEAM